MLCSLAVCSANRLTVPHLLVSGSSIEAAVDGASGLVLGVVYLAFFMTLLYLVARSRGTLPFARVYLLVGALLAARGAARVLDVWTAWSPGLWIDIVLTVATALAAVGVAAALPFLVPRIVAFLNDARAAEQQRVQLAAQAAVLKNQADLLELAYDAILVRRCGDGVITFWSRGAAEMYGWSKEDAIGVPAPTLLHTRFPCALQQIEATLDRTGRWDGQLTQTRSDRTPIVVESRWALQRDAHGLPLAYLEINRDITERDRTTAALREREASLEAAQRITHIGSWDWDVGTGSLGWSEELYRIFGETPGTFVPTYDRFLQAVDPADRARVDAAVHHALSNGHPYDVEFTIVHPNGIERVVHAQGELLRDEDAATVRMTGTVLDVTERTLAEHALARQLRAADVARSEMRAVLDATEEAIGLIAATGQVLIANRRAEELMALPEGSLVGRSIADLQERVTKVFEGSEAVQTLGALIVDPSQRVARDIRQRWPQERELAFFSTPVKAADGEMLGRLFAFRDVTREREAERAKSEFVSLVSHELRTPLTSIKGYVDLLLAGEVGELAPDQREFLEIVGRNADREVGLVNNLLDLSRLEAGQLQFRRTSLLLPP